MDLRRKQARCCAISLITAAPRTCFTDLLTISYSRSSGPGGQNVNKLSTKCTTRFALPSPTLIPPYILPALRSCPHYVASPPSVLLSSSVHRTQPQNLADCLRKLKLVLLDAAKRDLVGETSAEQKKKVQELAKKEKRRTEGQKKERKDVKSGRRTGKSSKDWD